jgi:hypothetical protein
MISFPDDDDPFILLEGWNSLESLTLPFDDEFVVDLGNNVTSLGIHDEVINITDASTGNMNTTIPSTSTTEPWDLSNADPIVGISIDSHSTQSRNNTHPIHIETPEILTSNINRPCGGFIVNFNDSFDNNFSWNPQNLRSAAIGYCNSSEMEPTNYNTSSPEVRFHSFQSTFENTVGASTRFKSTFRPSDNRAQRTTSCPSFLHLPVGFPQFNWVEDEIATVNPLSLNFSSPDFQFNFVDGEIIDPGSVPAQIVHKPLYDSLTMKTDQFDLTSITSYAAGFNTPRKQRSLGPEVKLSNDIFSIEIDDRDGFGIASSGIAGVELLTDLPINSTSNGIEMLSNTNISKFDSSNSQISQKSANDKSANNFVPLLMKQNSGEEHDLLTVNKKRFIPPLYYY